MLKSQIPGKLALAAGHHLPLCVLHSAAGYYLGTFDQEGPVSRESVEYWPTAGQAWAALQGEPGTDWTQRHQP